jgi:hypothetical protein
MGKVAKAEVDETPDYGITLDVGLPSQAMGAPAADADLKVGEVLLGRYKIEARLGSGGMGTVYQAEDRVRAEHAHIDGQVALKIAHAGPHKPASILDKLRHEFYCAQALSHPSIVKVYELEGSDELAFFTMELLEGEQLGELLKRSPKGLPRPQAWAIIREIGDGLAHAHSRNVVHADLKPQNVMVLKSGGLRILDFGTASIQAIGNGGAALTPSYASCQLLEGEEADQRDDIFALACLAYELLTGEHPFQRRRATEARDAGMTPKEPKNLSQAQWRALERGLGWSSEDRPSSVHEWLTELVLSSAPRWKGSPDGGVAESGSGKFGFGSMRWALALAAALAIGIGWTVVHSLSSKPVVAEAPSTAKAEPAPVALPTEADLSERESKMTDIDESVAAPIAAAKVRHVVVKPTGPVIEKIAFGEKNMNLDPSAKFAEVHVFRSAAQSDKTNFVWWTEAGSATDIADFLPQGHSTAYFSGKNHMTTLFVKLVPNTKRKKPQVFFLNIAEASDGAAIGATSRTAITLLPRGA